MNEIVILLAVRSIVMALVFMARRWIELDKQEKENAKKNHMWVKYRDTLSKGYSSPVLDVIEWVEQEREKQEKGDKQDENSSKG